LSLHGGDLSEKPEVLAMSKSELTGAEERREALELETGRKVLAISAVTGRGLAELVKQVCACLRDAAATPLVAEPTT
jgi:GTP-binding protein